MAHWTEELFIDSPELFQWNFEIRSEHVHLEVDFLLEKLKEHGFQAQKILDMNCGIGRHAIELSKRGIEVVGTDISPHYIDVAAKKAEEAGISDKATFLVADMRKIVASLSSAKPFDGVICMWTSFGFYDDATNEDILRQCLGLVKPGGFFLMDIINRDWLITGFSERGYQQMGDRMVLEERKLDPLTSKMINIWTFLRKQNEGNYRVEKTVNLDHRVWSMHELVSLFEKVGFKYEAVYTSFGPGFSPQQQIPLGFRETVRSRMLLYICRKP
ncbi:MAG TPA: class I SAM-dependent methyltransferase [Dehalococcoidia bacterium]|nr:class I SAM-dependent methyltransferase [Dehalococcoidia bacterium]